MLTYLFSEKQHKQKCRGVSDKPVDHSVGIDTWVYLAFKFIWGISILLQLIFVFGFRAMVEQITLSRWKNLRRPIQTTKVLHFLMKDTDMQLDG